MAPKKEMASEAEDVEDVVEASEAEASDAEASDVEESDVEESEAEASDAEESDVEESDVEAEASDAEETSDVEAEPSTLPNTSQKKPIVSTIGIEMLKSKTQKKPKKVESDEIEVSEGEEEDDEEEEEDVNYLQKFDNKMRDNFILDHHPEARTHNYEEVKALTRVTRDGRGIIIDPLHKTIPFLTKYEMTRVIGQRAKQLDSGAKSFAKVPINVIDGYYIALLELEQKKLPFIIKRPYPNGGVEYWNVSDLELLI